MTDLNTIVSATDPLQPYVTLTDAGGINDNRLIVANGVDSRTGQQHAYLLQVPPRIDEGTVLVLTLHGYGSNPEVMLRLTALSIPENCVVASLRGPNQHYLAGTPAGDWFASRRGLGLPIALAGTGGTPVNSSAGNATKLPPPATALMAPPSAPAKKRNMAL